MVDRDVAYLIVMAKEPVPGRVKTRLCPPCTAAEASAIAEGALLDTLEVLGRACESLRSELAIEATVVLALDGEVGPWLRSRPLVVAQRGDGLGQRLANASRDLPDATAPRIMVGMDTPQLRLEVLVAAGAGARAGRAQLGPADDGGYWLIGLPTALPEAFDGVPMSTDQTGAAQHRQLQRLGLTVDLLPALRDIDTMNDAVAVADTLPGSRTAAAVRRVVEPALHHVGVPQ